MTWSSEQLEVLSKGIAKIRDGLDKEHRRVGGMLGLPLDKKLHLERHDKHGHCFRVAKGDSKALDGRRECIVLSTTKAGTFFRTEALADLGAEFAIAAEDYERQQGELVREVVKIAGA